MKAVYVFSNDDTCHSIILAHLEVEMFYSFAAKQSASLGISIVARYTNISTRLRSAGGSSSFSMPLKDSI